MSNASPPPPGYGEAFPAVDVVVLSWVEAPGQEPLKATLRLAVHHSVALPTPAWALPGLYVRNDETVEDTIERVLRERVGVETPPGMEPIHIRPFSALDRDPRQRTISLPAIVTLPNRSGPEVERASWAAVEVSADGDDFRITLEGEPVVLPFDHDEILAEALRELQRRLAADDLTFLAGLLAPSFALRELERLWNALTGCPVNSGTFQRRMKGLTRTVGERAVPWISHRGEHGAHTSGRAPKLYRWTDR